MSLIKALDSNPWNASPVSRCRLRPPPTRLFTVRVVQTPQALVEAIRTGRLPQSDARPFCNQLAWLMSGQDTDYTGVVDEAEANRCRPAPRSACRVPA